MNQINILVPELPESISNATVITWHKKIGDIIQQDEILVDIETEKVILEVPAVTNGILLSILKSEGEIVNNKEILGYIKESRDKNIYNIIKKKNKNSQICNEDIILKKIKNQITHFSPSIRKLISKKNINISKILKINKKDLIQKENILDIKKNTQNKNITLNSRLTKTIKMTSIRKRIGERLLKTKNNTAMLTTFNEVNMQSIINMRNIYSKLFQDQHNVKLGFMSFFVKAVVESLKKYPDINSMIKEDNIIYYEYFDINIAVSTEKGLVTPVLRDVNLMNMAEIEKKIAYFSFQAKQDKLELSDLIGGNFTITNGGIFGSLMSTPIINPPQVAILGMHTIKDRPIVINKEIKILPMMYLALSYDHRMIDGKQAVGFLNMIKNILEDFSRILLDI